MNLGSVSTTVGPASQSEEGFTSYLPTATIANATVPKPINAGSSASNEPANTLVRETLIGNLILSLINCGKNIDLSFFHFRFRDCDFYSNCHHCSTKSKVGQSHNL